MVSAKKTAPEIAGTQAPIAADSWQIKLLYDSECPLCMREVNFLRRRDAGRGLVTFVDIADDRYSPDQNGGVDFETAMGRIHAVLPDGTVIKDVEVFRRVYEILGMGWIYAVTKLPLLGAIADWLYGIWADWRLTLTGRPNLDTIVRDRQARLECQIEGRCRLPE
ncbi:thiol-disulfide oxidoreductase DCC family protein [Pantanalinema rosaneae CENA516]|uniref:thiol-disulfide oxidoreductase DCC family protein n=1 Tax=Pantanalinema rosaneae TaxID=1620701 RepID=UPI003D6F64A0